MRADACLSSLPSFLLYLPTGRIVLSPSLGVMDTSPAGNSTACALLPLTRGGFTFLLRRRLQSIIAPKMPSATATTPATVPPAIAPTFDLDEPEPEPDMLDGLVPLLLLVFVPPPGFPAGGAVFSLIIVSRSGSVQPFVGAFLVEPPVLLLGN